MRGHECYHCKQWVDAGEIHDCWTTTEAALTRELSEDLREAWERLRETAIDFGEQRIYASHSSIMFSRTACYFFVRPKRAYLEVVIFLGRTVEARQVRNVVESSKVKKAHILRITHRDEVEAPVTDWLREAYDLSESLGARARSGGRKKKMAPRKKGANKKKRTKKKDATKKPATLSASLARTSRSAARGKRGTGRSLPSSSR
jgi:hypothetical protein